MRAQMGSVQDLLQIGVQDGVLTTAHGSAVVVEVSPLDLSLEPMEVYLQVEEAFRRFLVSLQEPVQIYLRKVRYSVDDYLRYLESTLQAESRSLAPNVNLIDLGHEFVNFIAARNTDFEYFRTHYYLVLWSSAGATAPEIRNIPVLGDLLAASTPQSASRRGAADIEHLRQRAADAIGALRRAKLGGRLLRDDDLIALLNSALNPDQLGAASNVGRNHLAPVTLLKERR